MRIIDGKYKGETGIVTFVKEDEKEVNHPIVKLDKSQRELKVNINIIKLKTDHDKDVQRLVEMGSKLGIGSSGGNSVWSTSASESRFYEIYRVGEVIMYDGSKTYGYII